MNARPLILTLISDIFFTVQVESVIRSLGYDLRRIERGDEIEQSDDQPETDDGTFLGEPLSGRGAGFVAQLAEWQPALIIVELSSQTIPWRHWIAAMKASPATRRIPVIAFGPHTDLDLRATALDVGVNAVVAKSRLVTGLAQLIDEYARLVDHPGLAADCHGEVSELAAKGIALFNAGDYFTAHEELEHAWVAETGPVRELYRGVLQVAVAYLQITRHNYRGALKMFLRMRQWLDPLPDECLGVNVAQLRQDAQAARAALESLGETRMAQFDHSLLKPVQFRPPS